MSIPLGSGAARSFAGACAPAKLSPGRTSTRKTSLLRIVPAACGQAADRHRRRDGAGRGDWHRRACAITLVLGDCVSPATSGHERIPERYYLFTMSEITHPRGASRRRGGCERLVSANEPDVRL